MIHHDAKSIFLLIRLISKQKNNRLLISRWYVLWIKINKKTNEFMWRLFRVDLFWSQSKSTCPCMRVYPELSVYHKHYI